MRETTTGVFSSLDRRLKAILRNVDQEKLTAEEKRELKNIKLACNEIRLDIRDYEYAQTRDEQLKWMKLARHNMAALNGIILRLGDIFSAIDVAELGASIDVIRSKLK